MENISQHLSSEPAGGCVLLAGMVTGQNERAARVGSKARSMGEMKGGSGLNLPAILENRQVLGQYLERFGRDTPEGCVRMFKAETL